MTLELTTVDAFTSLPFTGNPAAVALLDSFPSDAAHAGGGARDEPFGDGVRRAADRG